MIINRKSGIALFLVLLVVIIHISGRNAAFVENFYSRGIYPYLSQFMRAVLGWLPFSLGDFFYGSIVIWIIYRLITFKRSWTNYKSNGNAWLLFSGKLFRFLATVYIVFNLMWGLNYNRISLNDQLGLQETEYSVTELVQLNEMLLVKVNEQRSSLKENYPTKKEMFNRAEDIFHKSSEKYPLFKYKNASMKPSLWSWLGNYSGFTGYYNPFSGEAQVNTLVPEFLQPFIALHEIAHQVGYAKEDEANFVAFLVMKESSDTLFRYSGYLDLFLYANRNLYYADSSIAQEIRNKLSDPVKADLETYRSFVQRYRNPISPIISWIYGKYLVQNEQPQGMRSYDYVTAHLIYYYRKFGEL